MSAHTSATAFVPGGHWAHSVVAIEPQPLCMRFLQRWYGNDPAVTLIDSAVGAEQASLPLLVSIANPTVTTLSQEWIDAIRQDDSFADVTWEEADQVEVTTLDRLIALYGTPAFCKIDVEGYELEAFRGLSQPLAALSVEFIPAAADIAIGCIERLESLDPTSTTGRSAKITAGSPKTGSMLTVWLICWSRCRSMTDPAIFMPGACLCKINHSQLSIHHSQFQRIASPCPSTTKVLNSAGAQCWWRS